MATCPKCNKELEDGAKYCTACGAQIFETIFCSNCGEQTSTEFTFCQKCGAPIKKSAETSAAPAAPAGGKKGSSHALRKKAILFGGIGIAALAVILLVLSMRSGGSKGNYGLYLKDGEIVYTDYSEDGDMELSSRLLDDLSVDENDLAILGSSIIGSYIAFSEDGNRVFYPDRAEDDAEGITLYYRDINKPDEEPVKIDSDVVSYVINEDGTQVVYLKDPDGDLYLHDLTEKRKIASGVDDFETTDDLKKIGYLTDEDSIYLWYADQDAVKVASDVTSVKHVNADLSVVYYIKGDTLYKQAEGQNDREKIASDVNQIISIYDSGEVYYTKDEYTVKSLMDYVDDDMAASDATMLEPEDPAYPAEPEYPDYPDEPVYPSGWGYTGEEYEAAQLQYDTEYAAYEAECDRIREDYAAAHDAYEAECDRIWEDYSAALVEYQEKGNRDLLREELQSTAIGYPEHALYYSDGTKETLITDAVFDYSWKYANDKPVMVFRMDNQSDAQKVKLSEIWDIYKTADIYEARNMVDEALYSYSERCIAIGSALSVLEETDAADFTISSDGSMIYFLGDVSEEGVGDLYQVRITDGKPGKPMIYDSGVSGRGISFIASDKLAYFKNFDADDYKGDLYINGEEIDYDVRPWMVQHLNGVVLYYTDWNSEKQHGTLKMLKDGIKTKIADDVHDYEITNNNDILYLFDYSMKYYTGTLYLYNNGEPKKIDEDVIALIPVNDHEIKRESSYYV